MGLSSSPSPSNKEEEEESSSKSTFDESTECKIFPSQELEYKMLDDEGRGADACKEKEQAIKLFDDMCSWFVQKGSKKRNRMRQKSPSKGLNELSSFLPPLSPEVVVVGGGAFR
jgi:hypothetical protein